MNLSLIIIVVMIAAVIPWLSVKLWMAQPRKKSSDLLEEAEPIKPAIKSTRNPHAIILDCLNTELETKDILDMKKYSVAVVATEGKKFQGYDLLQAFTNAGLSYGQGKLFHYYIAKEIIFSVAPQSEPYYFEITKLSNFNTRGLNFIFDAYRSGYEDLAREVALQLADELQGEVRETLR